MVLWRLFSTYHRRDVYGVFLSEAHFCTVCTVFNVSAGAVSDDIRLAKDVDPYFKAQLCGGSRSPKAGTHYIEWAE